MTLYDGIAPEDLPIGVATVAIGRLFFIGLMRKALTGCDGARLRTWLQLIPGGVGGYVGKLLAYVFPVGAHPPGHAPITAGLQHF